MQPTFFSTQLKFRKWLEKNHAKETELLVGFYKVNSGKTSMTWSESVDQALCFGWIDGVRRSIDVDSYSIRFTPRRPKSIWSPINIKKVADLTKSGQMTSAGLKAFSYKTADSSAMYAHAKEPAPLTAYYEKEFKKNKTACQFFNTQAPSYKKVIVHWIMSAKQEKTQLTRLEKAIASSEQKKRIV